MNINRALKKIGLGNETNSVDAAGHLDVARRLLCNELEHAIDGMVAAGKDLPPEFHETIHALVAVKVCQRRLRKMRVKEIADARK